jgi:assimilatory nitrate reductase catalytic subunit
MAPGLERRLFEDNRFYHPDGRARFLFENPTELPEQPTHKYPFLLLTGRGSAAQWHTQTRTAKSAVLRKLYANDLYIEINPHDANRLGIRSGDVVAVSSQRGRLPARAVVAPTVQPGQLFIPMHYDTTNQLTHPSVDPYSHQPPYKACAVALAVHR